MPTILVKFQDRVSIAALIDAYPEQFDLRRRAAVQDTLNRYARALSYPLDWPIDKYRTQFDFFFELVRSTGIPLRLPFDELPSDWLPDVLSAAGSLAEKTDTPDRYDYVNLINYTKLVCPDPGKAERLLKRLKRFVPAKPRSAEPSPIEFVYLRSPAVPVQAIPDTDRKAFRTTHAQDQLRVDLCDVAIPGPTRQDFWSQLDLATYWSTPGPVVKAVTIHDLEMAMPANTRTSLPIQKPAAAWLRESTTQFNELHGCAVAGLLVNAWSAAAPPFSSGSINGVCGPSVQLNHYGTDTVDLDDPQYDNALLAAIFMARNRPGDVIEIVIANFANGTILPLETDPMVYDLIKVATASRLKLTVVEAAGNNSVDLDAYDQTQIEPGRRPGGTRTIRLPANVTEIQQWQQALTLRFTNRYYTYKPGYDSGAILVSGALPNPDHAHRINPFTFGSRIDCYGPAEKVLSTYSAPTQQTGYICKTSAATTLVAGLIVAIQSRKTAIIKAATFRQALRNAANLPTANATVTIPSATALATSV